MIRHKQRTPKSSFSTNNDGYSANEELDNTKTGAYSEVQAMQSGILAYAPANAKYSYVLDEETELEIAIKRGTDDSATYAYEKVQVPAGTLVMVCPDIILLQQLLLHLLLVLLILIQAQFMLNHRHLEQMLLLFRRMWNMRALLL